MHKYRWYLMQPHFDLRSYSMVTTLRSAHPSFGKREHPLVLTCERRTLWSRLIGPFLRTALLLADQHTGTQGLGWCWRHRTDGLLNIGQMCTQTDHWSVTSLLVFGVQWIAVVGLPHKTIDGSMGPVYLHICHLPMTSILELGKGSPKTKR